MMNKIQKPQNPEPGTQNHGNAAAYSYRNLIVWQKSQDLTLAVVKLVAGFPQTRVAQIITDQIVRSASSIGANIAEGHGRFSLPAHANYLSIAKASACETDNFLDLARRTGLITDGDEARLHDNCTEVIRMLTAKILDLNRQQKASTRPPRASDEPGIYSTTEDPYPPSSES